MTTRARVSAVVFCALSSLPACSSSRGFVPAPTPTPSPTATPTAAPGAVELSSATLSFTATGAGYAQPVTVTQASYSGVFTPSTTNCTGIATISPASGTSFSVTPVAAGSCTFTITGCGGQSATLSIGVTTTTVGGG